MGAAWRRGGRSARDRRFVTDNSGTVFILTDMEGSRCSHLNHALEVDVVTTMSRSWDNTVGGRRGNKH